MIREKFYPVTVDGELALRVVTRELVDERWCKVKTEHSVHAVNADIQPVDWGDHHQRYFEACKKDRSIGFVVNVNDEEKTITY